ncbi:LmeA family phospholipid-binding protein [Sphaerimonospora thailandensis]|uniref:LmeA family phospholipid-binding protein n=1 Tax=Sphaerimonospora thailandensis TaxID=795644 RepID=UPI00194F4E71|nr:DUF2993 domain-containing protein [Sphaerimonospora thailandensis]
MRKLILSLIVLVILLAIVDRVAVTGAQREIARQVASAYDLAESPSVEIKGFPFLAQAISGRYEEIEVGIGPMTREGIRLSSIDATLNGVTAPLADLIQNASKTPIRAERVTGTVVISRETLAARAPRGIRIEGDGGDTLKVSGDLTALGRTVPVTADLKMEVVPGAVRLTPTNVKIAGGITVPNVARHLGFTVPVKDLPLKLKITKVKTTSQGLAIQGVAADVPLH